MKVKLDEVIDALESTDDEVHSYYSKDTEKIEVVIEFSDDEDLAEKIEENYEHYIKLPDNYEIDAYGMMADFIDSLPAGDHQNQLAIGIGGRGAFRVFRQLVDSFGLTQQWYDFQTAAYKRLAVEWCADNDIVIDET